ncbi:MAG: DNA lyase [Spirochaetales bacterium]|nr:DNA lyase [Spirochaetales bacterium]
MRLWSLHPRYLDAKGLVAVWREALLARLVLQGRTRGYRRHPQLERFRAAPRPLAAINEYLRIIFREAERRGYRFDRRKLGPRSLTVRLTVSRGQLRFEMEHLRRKLLGRSPRALAGIARRKPPLLHPLFTVRSGGVAAWERGGKTRRQTVRKS